MCFRVANPLGFSHKCLYSVQSENAKYCWETLFNKATWINSMQRGRKAEGGSLRRHKTRERKREADKERCVLLVGRKRGVGRVQSTHLRQNKPPTWSSYCSLLLVDLLNDLCLGCWHRDILYKFDEDVSRNGTRPPLKIYDRTGSQPRKKERKYIHTIPYCAYTWIKLSSDGMNAKSTTFLCVMGYG